MIAIFYLLVLGLMIFLFIVFPLFMLILTVLFVLWMWYEVKHATFG
jgi:hypothetical protein